MERVEIEGSEPTPEQLLATTAAYGHFTAMQVRGGKTRGFELHLARLEAATALDRLLDRLPGVELDPARPAAVAGEVFRKPPALWVVF